MMAANRNTPAPSNSILKSIREISKAIFVEDKWIGIIINIALLIILVAIFAHTSGILEDGFSYLVARSWVPLTIAAGFLVVAKAASKPIYGHFILSIMMTVTIIIIAQALSGNRIPFIPPAYCAFEIKALGCPLSTLANTTNFKIAEEIEAGSINPSSQPSTAGSAATSTPESNPAFPGPSSGRIYVQFAGSLPRERIVNLAEQLASQGWNMQGADRGGKRTASAAGLNEIRYFHPQDKGAAESLANALAASANWIEGEILVKDFSNAKPSPPYGQLEIWTSV